MYIAPNSEIRLLTGVPIDKNQSDTLWFSSVANQTAYFKGKTKRTFTLQSYQRVNRGYCRLEVNPYSIYDCNYMMFQNTSYGSKWFYAFIDSIEYINNEVAEIQFTIDPIQSWFFDYTLNQCYIVRETPSSDAIGENILPEPIATGEYVLNGTYEKLWDTSTACVIIQFTDKTHDSSVVGGSFYNGVYSGYKLFAFRIDVSSYADALQAVLTNNDIYQNPDQINMMYMCPRKLVEEGFTDAKWASTNLADHVIGSGQTVIAYEFNEIGSRALTKTTPLDGYVPRNAKCYTYPYTYYHVDSGDGRGLVTRYEFFTGGEPRFKISGNATYPVELCCFPYLYKNSPTGTVSDMMEYRLEKLSIKGFPECSWAIDAYKAWVAQNSVPLAIEGGSMLVKSGVKALTGGFTTKKGTLDKGAIGSEINQYVDFAADVMQQQYEASLAADITKGSLASGSNDFAAGRMCFKGGCMTQPVQYMRSIDQFFDLFGYCVRRFGSVSIHNRTRWTFVQTRGANVEGGVPADDAKYIADCYDRGIRFWADTVHPCDYTTNNGFLTP